MKKYFDGKKFLNSPNLNSKTVAASFFDVKQAGELLVRLELDDADNSITRFRIQFHKRLYRQKDTREPYRDEESLFKSLGLAENRRSMVIRIHKAVAQTFNLRKGDRPLIAVMDNSSNNSDTDFVYFVSQDLDNERVWPAKDREMLIRDIIKVSNYELRYSLATCLCGY